MSPHKYVPQKTSIYFMAYFLLIMIVSIIVADRESSNSLFDYIVNLRMGGSASIMTLVFGVLPILAILLPTMIDKYEQDIVVLRIKQKRKLLNRLFIFSIFLSALFTIVMMMGGIVASWFINGHIENFWPSKKGTVYFLIENKDSFSQYIPYFENIRVWGSIVSSRFLSVLFIATAVIFLKTVLKKNILVFFSAIIILGTDGIFFNQFSLFLGKAKMNLDTWLDPEEQWFNFLYFILVITVFYLVSRKIYDKKEFYD